MMNIVQLQDQLKNFSQDQLIREMQAPSGNTPQYLVLGEIMRRKQMESAVAGQQAPQATVAEEAVAAAGVPQGGISDMARALAPQTDMAQNTGVQAMARGGPVKKMAAGDEVNRRPPAYLTDETLRIMANRQGMSVDKYLTSVGPERAAAIIADVQRRAAGQAAFIPNAFNENLPVRGTQTGSDEFSPTFGQVKNEALLGLGANASQAFTDADYYGPGADQGMPDLLTARETFRQENPLAMPSEGGPNDFRAPPARPSIFDEIGGTVSDIAKRYNAEVLRDSSDFRAPAPYAMPLTAEEQAIADERKRIYSNIGEAVSGAGQTIDDSVLGPAGAFLTEGRALAQDTKALAATLIPGFEGTAVSAKKQAELARQEAERLRQGGFFPNEPVDPAVAKEAAAAQRSSDAYKQMADTMKEAGIASLAGGKLAPVVAPAAATADTASQGSGTGGGVGGIGGGGGGRGGALSPYEQQLMDAIAAREKAAKQDKWLALAQIGLSMMSSTQPTLLGAVGEAGLKGIEALRAARDKYDEDKLSLQAALEKARMARASAAASAARGASRRAIPEGSLDMFDADIEALRAAASDPTVEPFAKLEAANKLREKLLQKEQWRNEYLAQFGFAPAGASTGASPATPPGVVFEDVPS